MNSRVLFTFAIVTLLFTSCKSKEEKAAELMDKYAFENAYDYQSYEPIKTTVSEAHNVFFTNKAAIAIAACIYEKIKYVVASGTDSEKNDLAEDGIAKMIDDDMDVFIYAYENQNKDSLIGYEIHHDYRIKNKLGEYAIYHECFYTDPDMKKVSIHYDRAEEKLTELTVEKILIIAYDRCRKAIDNIKDSEAFMKNKAKEKGVIKTSSGLLYKVIKKGNGVKPTSEESVARIHYEGKTIKGKVFDSSYERNASADLKLSNVIKGFQEGLMLMDEGSEYIFYIPYDLAFGSQGAGEDIKPYSALEFRVELLKVVQ